jgi:predicted Zn-dependent protease
MTARTSPSSIALPSPAAAPELLAGGLPADVGDAMTCLAAAELDAGRADVARVILEGLVVASPGEPAGWTLLSRTHRRLSQPLAARFCAEVALRLAPGDAEARLARAECLLGVPSERAGARSELAALAADPAVGDRARALLAALGE